MIGDGFEIPARAGDSGDAGRPESPGGPDRGPRPDGLAEAGLGLAGLEPAGFHPEGIDPEGLSRAGPGRPVRRLAVSESGLWGGIEVPGRGRPRGSSGAADALPDGRPSDGALAGPFSDPGPLAGPPAGTLIEEVRPGLTVIASGPAGGAAAEPRRLRLTGPALLVECLIPLPPGSSPGREVVGSAGGMELEIAPRPGLAKAGLAVEAALVEPLLGRDGCGGRDLAEFLAGPGGWREYSSGALSTDKRLVARQILACPLDGPWRRLFLEGKAMELLALFLGGTDPAARPGLSPQDVRKLRLAREILVSEMASPPSLKSLSRRCGLNEHKVKKGFREIFGESVGSLLRRERMAAALELLSRSDQSVGLVANSVGYSNHSHFIEAFRREFGHTPGRLRRLNR